MSIAVNFNLYTDNRVWPHIHENYSLSKWNPKGFLATDPRNKTSIFSFSMEKTKIKANDLHTLSEHSLFSLFSHRTPTEGTSYYGIFCKHLFIWKNEKGKKKKKKRREKTPKLLNCNYGNKQLVVTNTSGQQWMHDIETNVSNSTLTVPSSHSVPQEFIWGCTLNSKEHKLYQWSQQFTKLHLKHLHLKYNPDLDLFNWAHL